MVEGSRTKAMPLLRSFEHLDSGLPRNTEQVPSELITSCVAILLVTQVATTVRNRSSEMEAFYSLSLPDGVASVFGLIAMMIDQYSVLGESDVERGLLKYPNKLKSTSRYKSSCR
ncbi:hypothetical protein GQ457_07G020320 [Hibiscus cannabinus]